MRGNSLTSLIQKTLQEKHLPNTRPPFDAQLFSTGGQVGIKTMTSHDIQDMILVTVSKKADEDGCPSVIASVRSQCATLDSPTCPR